MREKAAEQGRREHFGEGANRERWAHVSIVQKKEEALVLGLDWHFFQSASIGEDHHSMILGETCFWTLFHKQELAEKGIEEYGRFLKTSEIFEANPWEATECSGDECCFLLNRMWVGRVAGPIHPHDNPAYMQSELCENVPRNLLPGYFSGYLCARKELEITQWEEWTGRAWTMLHWGKLLSHLVGWFIVS